MVGERGLEPPRTSYVHKALNLACLPISPLAHICKELLSNRDFSRKKAVAFCVFVQGKSIQKCPDGFGVDQKCRIFAHGNEEGDQLAIGITKRFSRIPDCKISRDDREITKHHGE